MKGGEVIERGGGGSLGEGKGRKNIIKGRGRESLRGKGEGGIIE